MKINLIFLVFLTILFLLFIRHSISVSYSNFINPTTCSQIWGGNCGSNINDSFTDLTGCDGTQHGSSENVTEVYLNASAVRPNEEINVTCLFKEIARSGVNEYISYYNGSGGNWTTIFQNTSMETVEGVRNVSSVFRVNSTEGTHYIRCTIYYGVGVQFTNNCALGEPGSPKYDNDDVNFTVVLPLEFDFWNLTNSTTGSTINSGVNLTRNDLINASAHWSKALNYSEIRHNGTGTFYNYTICSNSTTPCIGNWTNYTLSLSNTTYFNTTGLIEVSNIRANDSSGVWGFNWTSPSYYFYLWGSSKASNITINDSVIYNQSAVQVSCKVDDNATNSGISNYNVSFYENNTFLSTVSTNSSGWANYSYTVNVTTLPTTLNLKCNITDDAGKFYNASSENSKNTSLSLTELGIQVFTSSSLIYGNNVEITANTTGNASSITMIRANISFTNLTNGVYVQAFELENLTLNQTFSISDYRYNLTYRPLIPSNYSVNITVNAGKEKFNTTYFYVWGYSKLQEIRTNSTTIYNTSSIQIECSVKDNSTGNSTPSYNVSFYRNDTYIGSNTTNSSGWANYTQTFNEAILPINYSIKCNITDSASLFYNASSQNSNTTSLRVVNPNQVQVGDFWFEYLGTRTNKTNLNTNLTIYVNVSDTLQISTVLANISYPNNVINVNLSMSGDTSAGWHLWNYTFNNSQYPLNITGNYTVRVIANNSNGVQNVSNFLTFYANDTYDLNLTTNYTTYNRGENLTIQVWDVNGFSVQTLNWTINITRYNQTETTNLLNNLSYTYRPNTTDLVVNYTLFVNVSKQSNIGNNTWQFNISSTLYLNFTQPTENSEYSASAALVDEDTPRIKVYNTRNELLNYTINVTLSCPNVNFSLGLTGQEYYNNSATCRASSNSGITFQISSNASDVYNNTGNVSLNLRTQSSGETIITGGGGGGGGGGGNVTIIQNVTSNVTQEIRDFNFTVQKTEVQVYRGEDATIVGAVSNTGNTNLSLSSSILLNSTCCVVSIVPSTFNLKVGKAELPFTISIHVNASTEPDKEYFFDVKLKSESLEKSKRIKIIVKENPVISSLQQATGQIAEIENKIKEYKKVGLNIADLEGLLNKIKEALSGSQTHINKDDINTLKTDENTVKLSLSQINDQLNKLLFIKAVYENKWNISAGIITVFLTTYLVSQVFYPYYKLGKEIKALAEEEQSLIKTRVETEKQYFTRRINEQTFSGIMIEKQGKILKMRTDVKRKSEERSSLIKQRLHPLSIAVWIKNGLVKTSNSIKSLPRKIKERMKKDKSKEALVS